MTSHCFEGVWDHSSLKDLSALLIKQMGKHLRGIFVLFMSPAQNLLLGPRVTYLDIDRINKNMMDILSINQNLFIYRVLDDRNSNTFFEGTKMAALHCHHHICAKLMPSIQEPYIFSRFKILISSSIPSPSSSSIARCHPPPCSRIFHKTLYRRGYCTTSAIAGSSEDSSISVSSKSATSPISTFFAGDGVSWKSLGVSDDLSSALSNVSLQGPSLVQVLFNFHLIILTLSGSLI